MQHHLEHNILVHSSLSVCLSCAFSALMRCLSSAHSSPPQRFSTACRSASAACSEAAEIGVQPCMNTTCHGKHCPHLELSPHGQGLCSPEQSGSVEAVQLQRSGGVSNHRAEIRQGQLRSGHVEQNRDLIRFVISAGISW